MSTHTNTPNAPAASLEDIRFRYIIAVNRLLEAAEEARAIQNELLAAGDPIATDGNGELSKDLGQW